VANTRHFDFTVRLDSGLLIPAGAGTGLVLTSDSSGNATWGSSEKERYLEYGWTAEGEFATGERPGYFVALASGETKKIIAMTAVIASGVSCKVSIKQNGSILTELKEIEVTKTAAETKLTTPVSLSAKDLIKMEVFSVKEAPVELSVTVWVASKK
jgi:hypothetical protein